MAEVHTTTETRQGAFGTHTLTILIISTATAVILALGAYFYVFATDNEELAAPIPALEQSTADEAAPVASTAVPATDATTPTGAETTTTAPPAQ